MLRLWLDYDDLARVRIASGPSPIGTVVLSAQALRDRAPGVFLDSWRSRTRAKLTGPSRLLLDMVPPGLCLPDFLTPYVRTPGFEEELDALVSTPARQMRTDMELSYGPRPPASWMPRLGSGDKEAMHALVRAIREFHQVALVERWSGLRDQQRTEAAGLGRVMAAGGICGLLGALHPAMRWTSPVLEIETRRDGEVHLAGRGLLLVPSPFVTEPRVLVASEGPAIIVFPASGPLATGKPDPGALAKVFGRTRAAMLTELGPDGELTTGQLAVRLGVSAASASQHSAALRGAGLIISQRRGQTVHHQLTPLGASHLRG